MTQKTNILTTVKESKAQGSGLVRVKFLQSHPDYGYFAGDIVMIPSAAAEKLSQRKSRKERGITVIDMPYVELLPEGWIEPVVEKVVEKVKDPDFIPVRWIAPHPSFAYSSGDIGMVTIENLPMLISGGFAERILENDGANKKEDDTAIEESNTQGSDQVRVKFLRGHPLFAYAAGDVGVIPSAAAQELSQRKSKIKGGIIITEMPYVELLPEEWIEPVVEKGKDPVFIPVRWIAPHPSFAYSSGDIGMVTIENLPMLISGGFAERILENDGANRGAFLRIKDYLKTGK